MEKHWLLPSSLMLEERWEFSWRGASEPDSSRYMLGTSVAKGCKELGKAYTFKLKPFYCVSDYFLYSY